MKMQDSSNKYLEYFQNGEEKGFNFFFRQYHAALCYFSFQLLHNRNDSEEIVNDTFMKLWERHANFTSEGAIRSFLYTTVRNASLNRVRDQKRNARMNRQLSYLTGEEERDVSEKVIEAETYREMLVAINSLPPRCKQIFKMLLFDQKDQQQIANELKLSVSTVQNQKARAILLLRQRIALSFLVFIFLV